MKGVVRRDAPCWYDAAFFLMKMGDSVEYNDSHLIYRVRDYLTGDDHAINDA